MSSNNTTRCSAAVRQHYWQEQSYTSIWQHSYVTENFKNTTLNVTSGYIWPLTAYTVNKFVSISLDCVAENYWVKNITITHHLSLTNISKPHRERALSYLIWNSIISQDVPANKQMCQTLNEWQQLSHHYIITTCWNEY